MADNITNLNLSIKVDDGYRRIPITNMYDEEIGVFYFNPTDLGIIERYNKMAQTFDSVLDPIQALDDINILSMIDLLRNVAFSLHKQVILTTHDQNFFELLQKKIPQDKFNACYLKAVTRGKFERVS